MEQGLIRRHIVVTVLGLVPWFALFVALLFVSEASDLPRLGVRPDRPLWEVTARWLGEVLAVGLVVGTVWSALVETIALRRGVNQAGLRWATGVGAMVCIGLSGCLGEASGEQAFAFICAAFGVPLFAASSYMLRRFGQRLGGRPQPLSRLA